MSASHQVRTQVLMTRTAWESPRQETHTCEGCCWKLPKVTLLNAYVKQVVFQVKDKYDAALAELDRLQKKRDKARNKEIQAAISNSSRSYEDIMAFLKNDEEAE